MDEIVKAGKESKSFKEWDRDEYHRYLEKELDRVTMAYYYSRGYTEPQIKQLLDIRGGYSESR